MSEIQKANPDIIRQVMNEHKITVSDLSRPSIEGTIIMSHILDKQDKAMILQGALLRTQVDSVLKDEDQDPRIAEVLGATQYDALVNGILKLPKDLQNDIIEKKIQFRTINGELFMQAN